MCTNLSDINLNRSELCERSNGVDHVPSWAETSAVIYMIVTGCLAISGNGIIILVEMKNSCKTSTDWLVFYMAVNDLLFAVVNIPIYVMFHTGSWTTVGSDVGCMVHVFVEKTTVFSSTLLLCTVAVDRYFKTCRPHCRFLTTERAFRTCIAITIVSMLLSSPAFPTMEFNEQRSCIRRIFPGTAFIDMLHNLFIMTFLIMFVIVGFCYTRIAYTIKHRFKRISIPYKSNNASSSTYFTTTSGCYPSLFRKNRISPEETIECQPKRYKEKEGGEARDVSEISDRYLPESENERATKQVPLTGQNKNGAFESAAARAKSQTNTGKTTGNARMDKTTKIMFAVTLVFLFSWIPTWFTYILNNLTGNNKTRLILSIIFFGKYLFMINTFMNPLFYIIMSSVFKRRTQKVLQSLCRCNR